MQEFLSHCLTTAGTHRKFGHLQRFENLTQPQSPKLLTRVSWHPARTLAEAAFKQDPSLLLRLKAAHSGWEHTSKRSTFKENGVENSLYIWLKSCPFGWGESKWWVRSCQRWKESKEIWSAENVSGGGQCCWNAEVNRDIMTFCRECWNPLVMKSPQKAWEMICCSKFSHFLTLSL